MSQTASTRTVQVPLNRLGDFRTVRLGPGERLCWVCRGTGGNRPADKLVSVDCWKCEGEGKVNHGQ